MLKFNKSYSNAKQAVLPILISDYLGICDPVWIFDRFMEEMDLEKYLREIPKHDTGRPGYNLASMLKTVLFGLKGYISLRELEDSCKVNLRFMYLMEHDPRLIEHSEALSTKCSEIPLKRYFKDIDRKIFETEHVDL